MKLHMCCNYMWGYNYQVTPWILPHWYCLNLLSFKVRLNFWSCLHDFASLMVPFFVVIWCEAKHIRLQFWMFFNDNLGIKTLNRLFKGTRWHFITVVNQADSEVTKRLKSNQAKLPFFWSAFFQVWELNKLILVV